MLDKLVTAAIVVLLIMFGSVVAMGLPVLTAIAGVGASVLITMALASVFDFSTLTTALLSMMGLGVGTDYALFIISRFREERAAGQEIEPASSSRSFLFLPLRSPFDPPFPIVIHEPRTAGVHDHVSRQTFRSRSCLLFVLLLFGHVA